MATLRGRVLSIQSHVVHGCVGNTAATFPMQLLGYEVEALNSVHFCNHTGYRECTGQVLDSSDLKRLIGGLRSNGLLRYSHLLTGYVGSPSFLTELHDLVLELKQVNPELIYLCDPVLGDNGEMYVPSSLLPIYVEKLIPVADIITPNQFEAAWLSGVPIHSEEDAWKAIQVLQRKGAKSVVVTSIELQGSDSLVLLAGNKEGERMRVEFKKLEGSFTGTGDLFAAMLLGWSQHGLKVACEQAVAATHAVLTRTLQHALTLSGGEKPMVEHMELRLVQSKCDIEDPPSLMSST